MFSLYRSVNALHSLPSVSCLALSALLCGCGTSEDAEPGPAPDTDGSADLFAEGAEVSMDNQTPASETAGLCVFQTKGDYVHVSSSAFEASGHGWWVNGNCDATLAIVSVQLQQYYSDGSWRNVGQEGKDTVRSGGGAGNRATGRAGCTSGSTTGWRSVIDVDLIGLIDDPGKLITPTRNIPCRRQ